MVRQPLIAAVRFDPRPVNVEFVMDEVALGQGFLRVYRFSVASVIPPMFRIR